MMWYMRKDMTKKCDRSACEMNGRRIRGRRTTHVERGVHSWTISIGFSRPMIGFGDIPAPESQVDLLDSE